MIKQQEGLPLRPDTMEGSLTRRGIVPIDTQWNGDWRSCSRPLSIDRDYTSNCESETAFLVTYAKLFNQ